MTTMTALPGAPSIEKRLGRAWRKQRRFTWSRGACHMLLWIAAVLAVDVAADWFFVLPGSGRIILLVLNALVLALVAYRKWWRELLPFDPVRLALQVERRFQGLRSILVSYVQFASGADTGAGASPALVRAMQRQAMEQAAPLNFLEITRFAVLRRIFGACLAAALVLAAAGWLAPEFTRVFFLRIADPACELPYPTRTTIESITQDQKVQQGKPVTIRAAAGGVIPARGVLSIRPGEGAWERVVITRGAHNEFVYRLDEVFRSFSYSLRLGDAVSEVHQAVVVPPPRTEPGITLQYPKYTGLAPKTIDTLSFEVPEGTYVAWSMKSDVPLAKAEMVYSVQNAEWRVQSSATLNSELATLNPHFELRASQSFAYRFRWTDRDNRFVTEEGVRYFVRVIPDAAPKVELIEPVGDEKATVLKTLDVVFRATDDYGLSEAWIVYSLNGGEEQKLPIGKFEGNQKREGTGATTWPLRQSIPALKEGDLVSYAIEVADNRVGSGSGHGTETRNLARSNTRRIAIVSPSEYLRFVNDETKRLLSKIKGCQGEEKEAVETVGELERKNSN